MSIIRCGDCERFIDTDFAPSAYIEGRDKWVCEGCREKYPACGFCGNLDGEEGREIRQVHDGYGKIPPNYICEECWTPRDTGPGFDDLPKPEGTHA